MDEPIELDMDSVEAVGGKFIKFDLHWGLIPPGLGYETNGHV